MAIEKLRILGSDYIGAWVMATDDFFLLGNEVSHGEERIIAESIGVQGMRTSVGGFGFVGIYIAANTKGVLMPHGIEEKELHALRAQLPNVRVEVLDSDFNALKNNILTNDKIAIINPYYSKDEERRIGDVLDVEVVKHSIAGFSTVGANNILTNKGIVLNNRASDAENETIAAKVGLQPEQSTANLGSVSIGLCVIANSKGLLVGDSTTGFELSRIAEALDLS